MKLAIYVHITPPHLVQSNGGVRKFLHTTTATVSKVLNSFRFRSRQTGLNLVRSLISFLYRRSKCVDPQFWATLTAGSSTYIYYLLKRDSYQWHFADDIPRQVLTSSGRMVQTFLHSSDELSRQAWRSNTTRPHES